MSQSIKKSFVVRDTITLLLPHLRFVINLKESVMEPVKTIEYLGLVIDLMQMTLSPTKEKVKKI